MRRIFLYLALFFSVPVSGQQVLKFLNPRVNNASNIVVTGATTTTVTFTWTDGNESSRIVLMKSGSAVNSNPVNLTTYTASTTFGTGTQIGTGNYVVKIGSGPVTVTGLTQGVIYYIAVYEFNGSSGSESYNTINPATGYAAANCTEYQAVLDYATGQGWALPSISQQQIGTIYATRLVSSGLWAKKRVLWVPATDGDRNFAKINWKDPGNFTLQEVGTPAFTTNSGFSSADGTSYINTGFKLVTNAGGLYSSSSCHYSIHTSGPILNNDNYIDFGVANSSNNNAVWYGSATTNGNTSIRLNASASTNKVYDGVTYGYAIMERRTASSNTIFRQKNFVIDNTASTSSTPSDLNVYMCCLNANGTALAFSPRPISTLQIGTELGATLAFTDRELWGEYIEGIRGSRLVVNRGPYSTYETSLNIIATRDNYQFASDGYNLRWSSDYGTTWTIYPFGQDFSITPDYRYCVTGAHIFGTGTLIFFVSNKIYRSTDGLSTTPTQITPKHANGTTYTLHTPVDATKPGSYFHQYEVDLNSTLTNGSEIFVWGSYNSVTMGAAPANVWYTIDDGVTIKTAYEFGQNPNYRDNGTETGGATGTLLGDASNTAICRHIHSCTRRPGTLEWYMCTGDGGVGTGSGELNWIKLTYNEIADTWSSTSLYTNNGNSLWLSVGITFIGTDIYFSGEASGFSGVYQTTIANIGNTGLAVKKLNLPYTVVGFRTNVNSGFSANVVFDSNVVVAQNFGATFFNFPVPEYDAVNARLSFFGNIDSRGYYKFNVGGFGYNHAIKTIFIKEN